MSHLLIKCACSSWLAIDAVTSIDVVKIAVELWLKQHLTCPSWEIKALATMPEHEKDS